MDPFAANDLPIPPLRPLEARERARLAWLSRRLPPAWVSSVRHRRLLFLGLAAPGFLAVFTTTLHHNFFLLIGGFVLFAGAVLFRAVSEPLFVRATAAAAWSPDPVSSPPPPEYPHA